MKVFLEEDIKRARIIWVIIGYVLGLLAGTGSMYFMNKNKMDANLESMSQQLRLCEEQLDKK